MLGIVLTFFFAADIALAVLFARSEPEAPIRKVAIVFYAAQLLVGVLGGLYGVSRSL